MRELSIREMRQKLGSLDRLVKTEGEVIITRRGIPVARLLPLHGTHTKPNHEELRVKMQRLSTPSQILVRDDRDERL